MQNLITLLEHFSVLVMLFGAFTMGIVMVFVCCKALGEVFSQIINRDSK